MQESSTWRSRGSDCCTESGRRCVDYVWADGLASRDQIQRGMRGTTQTRPLHASPPMAYRTPADRERAVAAGHHFRQGLDMGDYEATNAERTFSRTRAWHGGRDGSITHGVNDPGSRHAARKFLPRSVSGRSCRTARGHDCVGPATRRRAAHHARLQRHGVAAFYIVQCGIR